jgi:hypothetical protein
MAQVFFRCSNSDRMLPNLCAADVDGLTEAREEATRAIHLLMALPGADDWRDWVMHVSDDLGEEMFALPFSSFVGRLH